MKPPSKNLQSILAALLTSAFISEGHSVQRRLSNNLRIDLKIAENKIVLLISRSSVYPSDTEWETILRHWPYPVKCTPEKLDPIQNTNRRHFLRGSWLNQPYLLQTDRSQRHPEEVYTS